MKLPSRNIVRALGYWVGPGMWSFSALKSSFAGTSYIPKTFLTYPSSSSPTGTWN